MAGIEVQVTDDGPALFEVVLQDSRGDAIECEPWEREQYAEELRERAFGLVLRREVRPLPAGRLVLDVARKEAVRLVARLGEGEAEPQARALLDGSEIDEGYLARAAREPRPFVRELRPDDLKHLAPEADRQSEDAADDPPLAA